MCVRLTSEFRHGWLVFECATEKRRLARVPADWEQLDDAALSALCQVARSI